MAARLPHLQQRTIRSGRRSIIPLYTLRADSYSSLAGVITLPGSFGESLINASFSIRFSDWLSQEKPLIRDQLFTVNAQCSPRLLRLTDLAINSTG